MTAHIQGYPEKHFAARMAQMNKPCFHAIKPLGRGEFSHLPCLRRKEPCGQGSQGLRSVLS